MKFLLLTFFIISGHSNSLSQGHPDLLWSKNVRSPIHFSPDGKFIFAAQGNSQIVRINCATGGIIDTVFDSFKQFYSVENFKISRDANLIAVYGESRLKIWDISEKRLSHTFEDYFEGRPMNFSSDKDEFAFAT
ncbi:MAG TPA: hypothetical protein VEC36_02640 [Patescibacteria group bacterium]|nr:hypothetical protein [Patescibacteria group bacterium]